MFCMLVDLENNAFFFLLKNDLQWDTQVPYVPPVIHTNDFAII